jgi:hypothetical protein
LVNVANSQRTNKSDQNIEVMMSNKARVESKTLSSWGGTRKKSGRPKLVPSSSVRVDTELLRQVRRFTFGTGNPRELIEASIRKELLERQTARDIHCRTVALGMIERNKAKGRVSSSQLLKIAGISSNTPQHKNTF